VGGIEPLIEEFRSITVRCMEFHKQLTGELQPPEEVVGSSVKLLEAAKALGQALSRMAEAGPAAGAAEGSGEAAEVSEEERAPAEVEIVRKLPVIRQIIEEDNLVVDTGDYRFVDKAAAILEGMAAGERTGEKGSRMLVDCVHFLDVLERDYMLPGYERLLEAVRSLRRELAAYLKDARGVVFDPDPTSPASDGPGALDQILGTRQVPFPSAMPAGQALALLKRGVSVESRSEPPEVLVSTGSASPAFEAADAACRALLRPVPQPPHVRQGKIAALKDIKRKYLPQLADADAEKEATVLRYVLNTLTPFDRGNLLKEPISRLLDALKERGLNQIPVRLGVPFDDSFGTGKYERKKVPSDQPPGIIVQIVQRGFVNRDGVPVQKAVLGISEGAAG